MPHAADSGFRIHSSSTKEAGISDIDAGQKRNDYICSINPKPLLPNISFLFREQYSGYWLFGVSQAVGYKLYRVKLNIPKKVLRVTHTPNFTFLSFSLLSFLMSKGI